MGDPADRRVSRSTGERSLGATIDKIGPFRVHEELPRGNTGRVFLAEDTDRNHEDRGAVVVKLFDRTHTNNDRFLNTLRHEAPMAVRFKHTFAARNVDVAYTGEQAYVVREFIDGMPVGALMERMGAQALLPWEFVVTLGVQMARLLATAKATPWQSGQQDGLLHGHLCCSNLYVTFSGFTKVVGVGFGRSRLGLSAGHRQLAFRAPELLLGEGMSSATDVYGLGVILHSLLIGQRGFAGSCVAETRQSVLHDTPQGIRQLRPEVPEVLERWILSMMSKRPLERPRDLGEIERGLRTLLRQPDAFYADALAQTMAIYFPALAKGSEDRRAQARMRRRLTAPAPPGQAWPARPSRPPEDSELSRGRPVPEVRHRIRTPPKPIPAVSVQKPGAVIHGPWDAQVSRPMLQGLEDSEPFDVDSVVDAIISGVHVPLESEVPVAENPLDDLVIEDLDADPYATLPPFHAFTPPKVENSCDLLVDGDLGLEAGTVLGGRYRLQGALGQGGASVVYRAEHIDLLKEVAVKVLKPELCVLKEAMQRFQREARAVSRLDHRNIVRVTDFGRTNNGSLFLVMELVNGQCLADMVRDRPLPTSMVLSIALEVLEGLSHAHAHGVVHRDLKPDNIMVDYVAGRVVAKVLDFGIAKVLEEPMDGGLTQPGRVFGTPRYMAPEQAQGLRVDARADLYAVGVCLYEMLSGVPPFPGDHALHVLQQVLTEEPPPLVLGPCTTIRTERVAAVVERAMCKEPAGRFASAQEMSLALRDCFFLNGPTAVALELR